MTNISVKGINNDLQFTVGRATSSGATAANSTNIVSNVTPLALPVTSPSMYMAALAHASGSPSHNCSGFAIDVPGAGTFYYTLWGSCETSHNFSDMAVALTVLKVAL
jgi:hypothetical protein